METQQPELPSSSDNLRCEIDSGQLFSTCSSINKTKTKPKNTKKQTATQKQQQTPPPPPPPVQYPVKL